MKKSRAFVSGCLLLFGSIAIAQSLKFPQFDYNSDCQKWRNAELVEVLHNDGGSLARFSPDELVQSCLKAQKRDMLAAQKMWENSSPWAQEHALEKARENTEIISPEAPRIFYSYLKKYLSAYANSAH